MIPADVAKSLQVAADSALRPVAPEQELADKLSGLVAGDKVMAQIQALLPNGTYRALINQRNITLALPFSAKSGDSLELQVTENDGKLALAVISAPGEGGEAGTDSANASARATLSRTGQLISTLYSETRNGDGTPAVPLNGNQPIGATPVSAQDLLPQLKQAITQSGMFYEAHQAEWVEGRFTKNALLQEPQGKLSAAEAFRPDADPTSATRAADAAGATANAGKAVADPTLALRPSSEPASGAASSASAPGSGQAIAPQTQALVQQQLEALATQNCSWQGQVWPGQTMRWDIEESRDEDGSRGAGDGDETATRWSTRLRLTLPMLGEIDARIRLQGDQITLSMAAGESATRDLLRSSGVSLRQALDEAGITLAAMGVAELPSESEHGQETR